MKPTLAIAAFMVVTCCAWMSSLAADPPAGPAHSTTTQAHAPAHAPTANQPVLPPAGIRWPAVVVMIVIGMFVAAIVIGPVVRLNMPEETPDAHSHDAHAAHGHDHGSPAGHH